MKTMPMDVPMVAQDAGPANAGPFESANITAADNGYNLEVHHKPKDIKKSHYVEPRHTVHPHAEHLLEHLRGVLAKHEGKGKKPAAHTPGVNLIKNPKEKK